MMIILCGLERMGEKAVMTYFKIITQNSAGMTGKSIKNIYHDSIYLQDLNQVLPKCK
jgi:hypothetical protein